jgi:hypothetical protein
MLQKRLTSDGKCPPLLFRNLESGWVLIIVNWFDPHLGSLRIEVKGEKSFGLKVVLFNGLVVDAKASILSDRHSRIVCCFLIKMSIAILDTLPFQSGSSLLKRLEPTTDLIDAYKDHLIPFVPLSIVHP